MLVKLAKSFFLALAIIVAVAFGLRFGYQYASAATLVDRQGTENNSAVPNNSEAWAQQFTPTQDNFVSLGIWTWVSTSTVVDWYLCEGQITSSSTYASYYQCNYPGHSLITSGSVSVSYPSQGAPNYGYQWVTATATSPVFVYAHSAYYVSFKARTGSVSQGSGVGNTDPTGQAFGSKPSYYNVNRDYFYNEYYDDSVNVVPVNIVSDNNALLDWNASLGMDYQTAVFQNEYYCLATSSPSYPCKVDFKFNSYAEGSVMYLYRSDSSGIPTGARLASTTIIENNLDTATLSMSATTTYSGLKTAYVGWLHDPDNLEIDRLYPFYINWLSEANMQALRERAQLHIYNISEACQDMDSTASSTFWYGVECGLRKVGYWAFTPSYETQLRFLETRQSLASQFPMSIYYQVKDSFLELSNEVASSSTSTAFSIPLITYGIDSDITLLDSNTISSKLGTTWTYFNDLASYFIYFITFLYFVKEIFRIAEKGTHDH